MKKQIRQIGLHREAVETCRDFKNSIKEEAEIDQTLHAAAFDYEKCLLTLSGPSSCFYYTTRLRNFNFTVTNLNNMESVCYLYNEADGGKGSNQVASFLCDYLASLDEKIKTVHFFCDHCGGQNCNRMVMYMLCLALHWFPHFDKFYLSFLTTGHSYSENDTTHSAIERQSNNLEMYTTDEWATIIREALQKPRSKLSGRIKRPTYKDSIDFKSDGMISSPHIFKAGVQKDDDNNNIKWSKIHQLYYSSESKNVMNYRYSYSREYRKVTIFRYSRRQTCVTSLKEMPKMYESIPGITKRRYDDLQYLCHHQDPPIIPSYYHNFYDNLTVKSPPPASIPPASMVIPDSESSESDSESSEEEPDNESCDA